MESINIKEKTSNPGPLGLYGFALTTILLNIHNAGFYGVTGMIMAMGIFYGGIAQLIAGIMEWKRGNQFGSIAFISYGSFWLTLVFIWVAPTLGLPKPEPIEMGCYLLFWGFFTLAMFVQTFNGRKIGIISFALLALLFMLLAIGTFTQNPSIMRIAGFEGIICGLVAFYEGTAIMVNEKYQRDILPM